VQLRFSDLEVITGLNRGELGALDLHWTVHLLIIWMTLSQIVVAWVLRAKENVAGLSTVLHCLELLHNLLHFLSQSLLLSHALIAYLCHALCLTR